MENSVLKGGDAPLTTLPKVGDYIVAPLHRDAHPESTTFSSYNSEWHVFKVKPYQTINKHILAMGCAMPAPYYEDLSGLGLRGYAFTSDLFTIGFFEKTYSVGKAYYVRMATPEERNKAIEKQYEHLKAEKEHFEKCARALGSEMANLLLERI